MAAIRGEQYSRERDYGYVDEERAYAEGLRDGRKEQRGTTRGGGVPASFWLGAGIGLIFATAAVVFAVEYNQRPKRRKANGEPEDDGLLVNLTEAVQEGLGVLSQAAQHLGYSFENARRELIRFGLDPLVGGIGGTGFYSSDDDPTAPLDEAFDAGYTDESDAVSGSEDEAAGSSANGDETHGED